jgi:allantoinase
MTFDLTIRGGLVVSKGIHAVIDVAITAGRVAALGTDLGPAATTWDARGLLVLPGLVDGHVHFREPGMTAKEDFASGTRSAAAGGVTTVIDMPNTLPPVSTLDEFKRKRDLVQPSAFVDFGLFGMLSEDSVDDIRDLAEAGACGLKLFMGETTGNNACPSDGAILAGLREAAAAKLVVGAHAENDSVLHLLRRELMAAGRTDAIAHLESRPDFVEVEAIQRFLTLAQAVEAKAHIHHLSTLHGLDAVAVAKARGARVTVEVLVAHLLLDAAAYDVYGNLIKLNPPIRPAMDRNALRTAARLGHIDSIGSDHAPHTGAEKAADNVWEAASGFIGVETMLPLLLNEVHAGLFSIDTLVQLCCAGPAKIWDLQGKGALSPGSDADVVLVDPDHAWKIDARNLHSKHKVTPFDGWDVTGRVVATLLRGIPVYRDGEVVGSAQGAMVRPRPVDREHAVAGSRS